MKERILLSWSGGKDSALALRSLFTDKQFDIISLLTTVTDEYDRVSMHGLSRSLLEAQAASLGIPVDIIRIPARASNAMYGRAMGEAMERWRGRSVRTVAFGDIHLADVRKYREENLGKAGMSAIFPLWGEEPRQLARKFVSSGFNALVTCVDTSMIDPSFSGRELDERFLADLPPGANPCGENGEYHSFVYDGPLFRQPVAWRRGESVLREERFMFTDVLPA